MTGHTLWPASITIDYNSNWGAHKMTLPIREWSPVSSGHISGTATDWNDTQADVDDFVNDFVDKLLPFFYTDTDFTAYTVHTYSSVNAPARPQVAQTLTGKTGTGASYNPGTQATFNFKTIGFFPFKVVMLDVAAGSQYLPVSAFPSPAYDTTIALRDFVLADASIFQGRDGTQVASLVKVTYTINEQLRKSYKLT